MSVQASGLMEVIERASSVLGAHPEREFKKATYEQLVSSGKNVLDPNLLNIEIPYENQEIHWVKGKQITEEGEKEIYVPVQFVYMFSNLFRRRSGLAS